MAPAGERLLGSIHQLAMAMLSVAIVHEVRLCALNTKYHILLQENTVLLLKNIKIQFWTEEYILISCLATQAWIELVGTRYLLTKHLYSYRAFSREAIPEHYIFFTHCRVKYIHSAVQIGSIDRQDNEMKQ